VTSTGDSRPRPLSIGITGGIASGKSTVSEIFAGLGAPVIDTDVIARDVVRPGTAGLARVVAEFGDGVLREDGELDREQMRRLVFADDGARRRLEGILHPLIWSQVRHQLAMNADAPYALVVVPLLTETGAADRLDRVLVVDCPASVQLERLKLRDGESDARARAILAAQASRADRLALADDVIVNDGDRAALEAEVVRLHRRYLELGR
jgi:dephospho-CoA kinase